MNARDIIDNIRNDFVDSEDAPTRIVTYTRANDDISINLNSFIDGGMFKQEEKDTIEDFISFCGLKLQQDPQINDIVTYDNKSYKVVRYKKIGLLYQVFAKKSRHSGKPKR